MKSVIVRLYLSFLLCGLQFLRVESGEYILKPNVLSDVKEHYLLSSFTNILSSSRYLDLVFVGPEHDSVTVRSYEANNMTYRDPPGYTFSFQNNENLTDYNIAGLLPADFNNDKTTDLMVVFANDKNKYKLALLWNHDNKFSWASYIEPTFSDMPHLLDYDGDLFVDFICAEEDQRYFYLNNVSKPGTFVKQEIASAHVDGALGSEITTSLYAYGDLNGDCAADLFMVSRLSNGSGIFEYYEAVGKELRLVFQRQIPEEAAADKYSAPLLVDMDGNGKLDVVLAGCSDVSAGVCTDSKIFTFYNDPCHAKSADECEKVSKACKKYDFSMDTLRQDLNVFVKFEHNKEPYGFIPYEESDIFTSKYLLRAADVDSDGHVDLVAVLKYDESQEAIIFFNVEDSAVTGGRTFRPDWRDDMTLEGDLTAAYVPFALAPVDALGIGNVQFFLIGQNKNDPSDFAMSFLVSKDMLDVFWIKVTVLCEECAKSKSTTMVGATAFYSTTGYKGDTEVGYGTQNSQLACNSLEAPYMLFGLGQQANYIEALTVAYRDSGKEPPVDPYTFDNLIPNAQVFAIPMGGMWKLVMMVVPGKTLWQTLIVLGVCSLVCVILILILHIKEKKEDEREKVKFNTKFNFDAM